MTRLYKGENKLIFYTIMYFLVSLIFLSFFFKKYTPERFQLVLSYDFDRFRYWDRLGLVA